MNLRNSYIMIFQKNKNWNNVVRQIMIIAIIAFLAFLLMMQSPLCIWKHEETGTDSSVFKYVAFALSKGKMPYRDTFDHKGPLLYILNYIGQAISYWRGIWIIEFVNCFVAFGAIYKIARLRCGKIMSCTVLMISAAPLFTYFHGGNLTEEYALPFIAVSLYFFLDYLINGKVTCLRLIVIGISFAAVCMLRPNMVSVWAVFCMTILIDCLYKRRWQELRRFIVFFLIGVILLAGPILIWLAINNSLDDFFEVYIKFNIRYSSPTEWTRSSGGNRYSAFVTFLNESRVLYAVMIMIYQVTKRKDVLNVSYLFYFIVTLMFISISGMATIHYAMILIPMIAWPITEMMSLVEKSYHQNNALVLFVLMYFMASFSLPIWINATNNVVQVYANRVNSQYSQQVQDISIMIEMNTDEEDYITVCGNWDIIYNVTQRLSSSKYSYQLPIGNADSGIMEEYFMEISENKPKVVVVTQNARNDYAMEKRIEQFLDDNNYHMIWNEKDDGSGTQLFLLPEK